MGESLVPTLRGEKPALKRPIFHEKRFAQALLFPDGHKVIADWRKMTEELYDLSRDPRETQNLCDDLAAECAERLALLRTFFAIHDER
jgi:hypothetical protein